jgi:hypothetical protein
LVYQSLAGVSEPMPAEGWQKAGMAYPDTLSAGII